MSKESFIGGDYIETTSGDTKVYGESICNSSSSKFVQNGGAGVEYGMAPSSILNTWTQHIVITLNLCHEFTPKELGSEKERRSTAVYGAARHQPGLAGVQCFNCCDL